MAAKKKVLIVDDDPTLIQTLTCRCEELGLCVQSASDGLDALMIVLKGPPDLVILDVNMPSVDGLSVGEKLTLDHRLAPIPVILLTDRSDEVMIRRCEELGAHYVHKGIDAWDQLKPLICELLQIQAGPTEAAVTFSEKPSAPGAEAAPPKVLIIDDDLHLSKAIKIRLQAYGVKVLREFSGQQGYWTALKEKPDVVILDYIMPDGYGNQVLRHFSNGGMTERMAVIVLTGHTISGKKDYALERDMRTCGASAFLMKPLDFDALLAELRKYIRLPAEPTVQLAP